MLHSVANTMYSGPLWHPVSSSSSSSSSTDPRMEERRYRQGKQNTEMDPHALLPNLFLWPSDMRRGGFTEPSAHAWLYTWAFKVWGAYHVLVQSVGIYIPPLFLLNTQYIHTHTHTHTHTHSPKHTHTHTGPRTHTHTGEYALTKTTQTHTHTQANRLMHTQ